MLWLRAALVVMFLCFRAAEQALLEHGEETSFSRVRSRKGAAIAGSIADAKDHAYRGFIDNAVPAKRIFFFDDSQAAEAGLDKVIAEMLRARNYDPSAIVQSGQCMVQPKSAEFPNCWSETPAVASIVDSCKDEKPDVVVLWMGVNDLKVQNHQGSHFGDDLSKLLNKSASACGFPKFVVVKPPLFECENNTSNEWPNSAIAAMVQAAENVFTKLQEEDAPLQVVDAQKLSNIADFDRVGHFCTDKRQCKTSMAISSAIVDAVERMFEWSFPGTGVLLAPNTSNTSTWMSILAVTCPPFVLIESAVVAFRASAPLECNAHSSTRPAWLPLLDLARLLGAMHIVAFHFFQSSAPVFAFGKYWISFFLFVSGFSHVYAANSREPLENIKHGCGKFYSGHFLGLLLFLMGNSESVSSALACDFLTSLTLTQAILPPFHNSLNGPSWFLSTLVAFWMLAPHWGRWLEKLTPAQHGALLVFCWLATLGSPLACHILDLNLNLGGDVAQFVEFNFTQRWPVYLGGMVFAHVARNCQSMQSHRGLLTAAVLLVLASGILISKTHPPGFALDTSYMIFGHGFGTLPMCCAFGWLALALPGKELITQLAGLLSWPIYILHAPVMALMLRVGGEQFQLWHFWCTLGVLSCGLAAFDRLAPSFGGELKSSHTKASETDV